MSEENETNGGGQQQLALLDFATAESMRAEPSRLREVTRELIRKTEVWNMLLPHYVDGGKAGSLQFDKAVAAYKLRVWDKKNLGLLDAFPDLTEQQLAGAIAKELRRFYDLQGGRIVANKQLAGPAPSNVAA